MMSRMASTRPLAVLAFALSTMSLWLAPSTATAQPQFVVTPVAEKKLAQLPAGPLYWWVENFPTLAQAQAAEGRTSLAAEVAGKVWLFTLGPIGGATPGGTKVAEVGPVPPITAPEYLLRITHSGGPPGAKTPVHSHPGAEAFYALNRTYGPEDTAWRHRHRGRPIHERAWRRYADGGLQCRRDRSRRACHVRGRRHRETVRGASQLPMK